MLISSPLAGGFSDFGRLSSNQATMSFSVSREVPNKALTVSILGGMGTVWGTPWVSFTFPSTLLVKGCDPLELVICAIGSLPVGVGDKVWETLHPLLHPGKLGMEDVDSILGNPDAVLVDVVVAVPPNVLPLLDHQGGETQTRTGLQSLFLLSQLMEVISPARRPQHRRVRPQQWSGHTPLSARAHPWDQTSNCCV